MIEIWSKPQCPFCDRAENLCKQKNFDYKKYMDKVDGDLYEHYRCFKGYGSCIDRPEFL